MKSKITGINRTLFELETGILIFGIICQPFMLLPEDKAGCSAGLWLGILLAAASAFHMWRSLDRALDLEENQAVKTMGLNNVFRYCFIVTAFALKASAYMHFITRKISARIYGEEILPPLVEEPANGQDR